MNKWLDRINQTQPVQTPTDRRITFNNPAERFQYILNAMRNPVSFVKEQFPDVPENIVNNPDAVLQYLGKTRGNDFYKMMQQVQGMYGRR